MSAVISLCKKYRYILRREIDADARWIKPALFIMLNPSTADAEKNDPTIRRCIHFAKREGCTHLTVLNLFAYRATDPSELEKATDPIGLANDGCLDYEIAKANRNGHLIVAAWGANPFAEERIKQILEKHGGFKCLGYTKAGAPRHPLYVRSDAPLLSFPKEET